jgi:hypothetical protein
LVRIDRKAQVKIGQLAPLSGVNPSTAASDSQGNLYLLDRTRRAVYKYRQDFTRKGVIGEGDLTAPTALAVDPAGGILVLDGSRVLVFRARPAEVSPPDSTRATNPPTAGGSDGAG